MKLYFGNVVTSITTLMNVALLIFIIYCIFNHANITYWGRKSLMLLIFGLVVCCFAAARDGLDKTIQNAIDSSCKKGLFSLVSIPTIIGCIGALLIIVSAILTLFIKKESMREIFFFIMSSGVILKIMTIEIARVFCS
ncbi:MAG TPA: hypothetical protein DD377_02465 [Firmicutes bacterium]|mgnify:FL=1|nr:hypothetical protein [Bacillota bacterium]